MHELQLETRKRIYDCIVASPGLHFREIQRRVGIATGSIDYHLHYLHRHGLVRTENIGKYVRYYPLTKNFSDEEKKFISLLRQKNVRRILIYIIERKTANPADIAAVLGFSPSTLSWYLKKLEESGIIVHTKRGRFRNYKVIDKDTIVRYLILHKSSFLDEMVDRFIDTWGAKYSISDPKQQA
ncbi:MAG: winged helix-turn-helix transcriptional regulator [Candidatus Aenigmarchaeota archaeon]|nr:winged helix-turn-helix transcriptional regulator [Candidatus Aenigmarchaeota archaeon]